MKLVIYGCGDFGKRIYNYIKNSHDVVAFCDGNKSMWGKNHVGGLKVVSPDDLKGLDWEQIFISVDSPTGIKEIQNKLEKDCGIDPKNIIIASSAHKFMDAFITTRTIFMEKCAEMIADRKIPGNIAECGVYRGNTARFLNKYFPEKKLYLFDTFGGFSEKDLAAEHELKDERYASGGFDNRVEIFKDTSIEHVMDKMLYPENVVIKQGWFPESAEDIDDKFSLVHLDMDLYKPTKDALRFFWDKVSLGGYVLMHDYYGDDLPGIKKAVEDFSAETGYEMHIAPIGDERSIVIVK